MHYISLKKEKVLDFGNGLVFFGTATNTNSYLGHVELNGELIGQSSLLKSACSEISTTKESGTKNDRLRNFAEYTDSFSFTVLTELDAYKRAHEYQHAKEVRVRFAKNIGEWLVQVFR